MKKLNKIILIILLFVAFALIFTSIYIKSDFGFATVELLIYSLKYSKGTSSSVIKEGLFYVLRGVGFSFLILYLIKKIYHKFSVNEFLVKMTIRNKKIELSAFSLTTLKKYICTIIFLICSIVFALHHIGIFEYINLQKTDSQFFEDYYVEPREVDINFENKRNLIYIYVESLEATSFSSSIGGGFTETIIPNLQNLALNNTSFSNFETPGGIISLTGTTWTAGALVAMNSGVPLKLPIDDNLYSNYSDSLPGAYSVGEILLENDYSNYFMMGSEATFGGRKDYLESHGDYQIYDYSYAIDNNWLEDDYHVWWGFEDEKLFEFAKEKLIEIASSEEHFNFSMLTADTHFTDGYLSDSCETPFERQYENAFYCSDSMIFDFVEWIKRQDFYDNTVIIITGDHPTMQPDLYSGDNWVPVDRTVYNVFINSEVKPESDRLKNASTFDMFPSVLSAMGATIEGERLALGTNLFSSEKTLMDKLGGPHMNSSLSQNSLFYNNYILGDTYYEMTEENKILDKKTD